MPPPSSPPTTGVSGLVTVVLAALLLTGCGGAPAGTPGASVSPPVHIAVDGTAARTRYPLTLDNCGRRVTFTAPPRRVVVLSGASVAESESLLMLGLGDRVIVNAQHYGASDAPGLADALAALPTGGLTPNSSFDLPAEPVLAAHADLVISSWPGGFAGGSGFATRDQLAGVGANTLVDPTDCAMGDPHASPREQRVYQQASPESALRLLVLLGQVFDVQDRAHAVAGRLADRINAANARVAGTPAVPALVTYPGLGGGQDGVPTVLAGGTYDRVLAAAGAVDVFPDTGRTFSRTISAEQLAAADVALLVVGVAGPHEDARAEADRLFAAYPGWTASRRHAYVTVSDGMFPGPTNAWAIERIARAAHPDRF
jgi:iron complex transport system substrate-binding protein